MKLAWDLRAVGVGAALVLCVGCSSDGTAGTGDPGTSGDTDDGSGSTSTTGPGGTEGDTEGELSCPQIEVGQQPLRRLTRAQYSNMVRDILGLSAHVETLDADEKAGPFDSNGYAPVSGVQVEQYRLLAEELGTDSMAVAAQLVSCDPSAEGCDREFIRDIGRSLYRRPLTNPEVAAYLGLFARGEDFDNGVRLVVQAMLQSAAFLYHLEFGLAEPTGEDVVALDGYELASRLSFFLWNSGPDRELLDAAQAGMLDTPEGLASEAQRLLGDTRARDAISAFHTQWLAVDELPELLKDDELYPQFDESLRTAMQDELRRFTQAVILVGDGKLETLLTAPYSYIDGPLFDLYGVERPNGHSPGTPVDMPEGQRAGLLTTAAFLATHAHADTSGPIQRGAAVRTNFLCQPPPPPPPDINVTPPAPDPNATTREIYEQHTADPACSSCHSLIDGLGLGFEGYDAIGAYREVENGLPVDQSGEIVSTVDIDGEFNGVVELATALSTSQQVRECVSRQWFRYAFGRIETDQDACTVDLLDEAFAASDYDIRALLIAIVRSDSFRYRAAQD